MTQSLLHRNDRPGVHAPSWYAASANPFPALPVLDGGRQTEICVVGAGYTGLSTALHLAERGHRVTVLEAHRAGWGASGRNGGQVASGQRLDPEKLTRLAGPDLARAAFRIGAAAADLVRELINRHQIACAYKAGILSVNHRARFDAHSRRHVETLTRDHGADLLEYLTPEAVAERLGAAGYSGGHIDWRGGHLHPLNYALGLARAAQTAGAELFERTEVTAIEPGARHRVVTARGVVEAEHVVLACNGYHCGLEGRTAAHVMPINNFIIATEPLGEDMAKSLIRDDVAVADSRFVVNYFRLSEDRRMLFGGGESYGDAFPSDIKAYVRGRMLRIFPQLADARVDYGWGGTLAITLNRTPYFAEVAPRLWTASGYSGSGVAMATMAGRILADAISGHTDHFDVMAALPTPTFPGASLLRRPLLALAMTWFGIRDRY
jgi:gamma-glutamylputrescine oxidase